MSNDTPKKLHKEQLRQLIIVNPDARQYFYAKADERWLDWFWQNGFLDVIKEKAKDPTRYGDVPPELSYLARMSKTVPTKVVDIMLQVPITSETLNPVVLDRFFAICSTNLPPNQLARMVEKIRDERWTPLLGSLKIKSFAYKKMFQTLADAHKYQSLLVLADAVLAVRTQAEIEQAPHPYGNSPFYIDDLSRTKIFEYLYQAEDEYTEEAFDLATKIMAAVIAAEWGKKSDLGQLTQLAEEALDETIGVKRERAEVFKVADSFSLLNVDFFDLTPDRADRSSSTYNLRDLATVVTVLAEKLIGSRCENPQAVRDVYEKYLGDFDDPAATLPDSKAMWRLRLFVLSLCPEAFKDKLKRVLFRLFDVEQYYEIIEGTEYRKALQKGFPALYEEDRRQYVNRVLDYFTQQDSEKESEEENWHIPNGSRVLSMIATQLTEEEKCRAEEVGFKLDPNYQPERTIGRARTYSIAPRGPIPEEEFGELSIAQIVEALRNEWTPNELTKRNTTADFHNPCNADGISESLKRDMPNRLEEYVRNAENFFERGVLDEHYTYSFLRAVQETIHAHGETASRVRWDGVIDLCMAIKASGEQVSFDEKKRGRNLFDTWLASWGAVHLAMTNVLKALVTEKSGFLPIDFPEYRDRIFTIVSYLLSYPDPLPEDEQIETATSTTKPSYDVDSRVSDPFHMAVNSVRGQAFETFMFFVDQDGKKFKKEDAVKIAGDVKEVYESSLKKETTRAIMFMFGRYLPHFYFRDRAWLRRLLPQIFQQGLAKKYLYTAAWEGYLVNDLYEAMFFDPKIQELYRRGLALTDDDYPRQQEHFKKPGESIAVHLALAYMHYQNFGFAHPLYQAFWKETNPDQHADFVDFLGRSYASGNNPNARKLLSKDPEGKERLREFWNWLLENYEDPKPFIQFDSWINLENGFFDPAWLAERVRKTLEKTRGELDSEFKLTESIARLARGNPEDTLEIARWYLHEGGIQRGKQRELLLSTDDWVQWREAFKILHENKLTKWKTAALISKLIRDGGRPFWDLKEITAT